MKKINYIFTLLLFSTVLFFSACDSTGADENETAMVGTWESTEDKYYFEITASTLTDYELIRTENCYDSFSSEYDILESQGTVYTVEIEGDSNEYEIAVDDGELTMRSGGEVIVNMIASDVSTGSLEMCKSLSAILFVIRHRQPLLLRYLYINHLKILLQRPEIGVQKVFEAGQRL